MNNLEFIWNLGGTDIGTTIKIIERCFTILFTYYLYVKIINIKNVTLKNKIIAIISIPIISYITLYLKLNVDIYLAITILITLMTIINKIMYKKDFNYTLLITIISYCISYALYLIAVLIAFFPTALFMISNDYLNLCIILIIYTIMTIKLFKIKKLKYGISFLQKKLENTYLNILILNIGIIVTFIDLIFSNIPISSIIKTGALLQVSLIYMFFILWQSFKAYYKQKQLIKDYEETKAELEKEKKEKQEFKDKLLKDSKARHSVVYKQDSLEEKMDKILQLDSISEDEKEKLKVEFGKISDEVYKEPGRMELAKTDIPLVDDMLEHMQTKCIKNKIDFELQIVGDIHYMVNHLVTEDELRILLADHIKDAIIAINSSDNTNRSILVRLGKIDNVYSVYIYDSGVEFTKEVLDKLGKEPITTHEDTGGTGMGFMNTFDLLKKYDASLTIKEIGIPTKDNYTKVLMFKFDNQGEFKVESYKNENLTVQKS